MKELLEEIQKLVKRVKDLEQASLRVVSIVFGTGKGKLQVPKYHGDPADAANGDYWYDLDSGKQRTREGGVNKNVI